MRKFRRAVAILVTLLALCPMPAPAYSVLTHEAIIDVMWDTSLRPLLRKRYPDAMDDQLLEAHAYAYGGSIIQDMGYYPSGSKFFSDLTHYFRSGDFIRALVRDASDLNEYAFALGALAHYAADNEGHSLATNHAVPMLYPELQKRYGQVITYEDDPLAHIKTEFAFDVLQVAKGRYASESYHNFVGFEVALPLLQRAFRETYGIDLKSVVKDEARAANSYRYSVSTLVPKATRVAWDLKQDDIRRDLPGVTEKKFLYNLSRSSYEKEWGHDYYRPTVGDNLLAFLIRILPKVGPLRILTFRTPTPQAEKLFENSFNAAVDRYHHLLRQSDEGGLELPNDNFDVGGVTALGVYKLSDKTCAELLHRLAKEHLTNIDPQLKSQLLGYYAPSGPAPTTIQHGKSGRRIKQDLTLLKDLPANSGGTIHP